MLIIIFPPTHPTPLAPRVADAIKAVQYGTVQQYSTIMVQAVPPADGLRKDVKTSPKFKKKNFDVDHYTRSSKGVVWGGVASQTHFCGGEPPWAGTTAETSVVTETGVTEVRAALNIADLLVVYTRVVPMPRAWQEKRCHLEFSVFRTACHHVHGYAPRYE